MSPTGIFTVVFGVVFILLGLNFARGERRAAARGQRRVRRGYVVACLFIVVLGGFALLLAVPTFFEPSNDGGFG